MVLPTLDRAPSSISDPALDAFPITPDDDNELATIPRALIVATGGDLHVITAKGNERIITVPAGIVPLRVKKVFLSGTTAQGISGLID